MASARVEEEEENETNPKREKLTRERCSGRSRKKKESRKH